MMGFNYCNLESVIGHPFSEGKKLAGFWTQSLSRRILSYDLLGFCAPVYDMTEKQMDGGEEMTTIYPDLYQFSVYIQPMRFTIHQYLLLSEEPVLISTGTVQQAIQILPKIEKILNGKVEFITAGHGFCVKCIWKQWILFLTFAGNSRKKTYPLYAGHGCDLICFIFYIRHTILCNMKSSQKPS